MVNKRIIGVCITTLSVVIAVSVLAALLLVATARTPEQLRQIGSHTNYVQQAVASISRGLEVSQALHRPFGTKIVSLDVALERGIDELRTNIKQTYEPSSTLQNLRWGVIEWLNVIDAEAGALQVPEEVLANETSIEASIAVLRTQFSNYGLAQKDLFAGEAIFAKSSKEIVGFFRQNNQQRRADNIYVSTEQIQKLLRIGHSADLDGVLEIIDQLEKVEAVLKPSQRSQLRLLINSTYTLISLKRATNQAIDAMQQDVLQIQLELLSDQVTSDQIYVLGAVNDSRVLLNVYTVLLLAVLGFFGLRLAASHRQLNRSHDDLEVRVEERTADLEQANEDLKESQVQLVQAEKMSSLGQLVAGVMHEINTPLLYVLNNTSVTSEAVNDLAKYIEASIPILEAKTSADGKQAIQQFLARREEFDVAELRENVEEVESLSVDSIDGLNQISELVQSLKDFSRLDRIADDTFDVREGIEKTLTITRNLLKQGVEVEKDFAEVPKIFCSPQRLNQVFINIINNAVQAMDGQGTLKISTAHVQSSQGDSVEIAFTDTGCGIPQEHIDKIMDPFFTTKPVGEGTGLGLSIVHQIIEQHGGQILVDSKEGHGTRIVLNFPTDGPVGKSREIDKEEAA